MMLWLWKTFEAGYCVFTGECTSGQGYQRENNIWTKNVLLEATGTIWSSGAARCAIDTRIQRGFCPPGNL